MFIKKSDEPKPATKARDLLFHLVLPGIILCLIAFIDANMIKRFNVLPTVSALSFLVFSFFMNSRWLRRWTIILCLFIAAVLCIKRGMWQGADINVTAMIITRTLSTAVAGILACVLAATREQQLAARYTLGSLLEHLGAPVIVSDEDGWIIYTNEAANTILNGKEIYRKPYFDHFFTVSEKGKAIQKYLDLTSGAVSEPISIHFTMGSKRETVFSAVLLRLQLGKKNHILTMIHPEKTLSQEDTSS